LTPATQALSSTPLSPPANYSSPEATTAPSSPAPRVFLTHEETASAAMALAHPPRFNEDWWAAPYQDPVWFSSLPTTMSAGSAVVRLGLATSRVQDASMPPHSVWNATPFPLEFYTHSDRLHYRWATPYGRSSGIDTGITARVAYDFSVPPGELCTDPVAFRPYPTEGRMVQLARGRRKDFCPTPQISI
jgi:hypothetical protein